MSSATPLTVFERWPALQPAVEQWLVRHGASADDAHDLAIEALLRGAAAERRGQQIHDGYLWLAVRSCLIDWRRRQRYRCHVAFDVLDPYPDQPVDIDLVENMVADELLAELTPDQQAVAQALAETRSWYQVTARLGLSRDRIRRTLWAARARLRAAGWHA